MKKNRMSDDTPEKENPMLKQVFCPYFHHPHDLSDNSLTSPLRPPQRLQYGLYR